MCAGDYLDRMLDISDRRVGKYFSLGHSVQDFAILEYRKKFCDIDVYI